MLDSFRADFFLFRFSLRYSKDLHQKKTFCETIRLSFDMKSKKHSLMSSHP